MIFAFDVDGVIFHMWKGDFDLHKVGDVIKGAKETLNWIRQRGHKVVIFTCRTNPALNRFNNGSLFELVLVLYRHLEEHEIPYDDVASFKPFADWYWDDRSNFVHWERVKSEILNMESEYGYSPTDV